MHSSPFSTALGGGGNSQLPVPPANAGGIPIAMSVTGLATDPAAPPALLVSTQQDAIRKLAEATKMNFNYCEKYVGG